MKNTILWIASVVVFAAGAKDVPAGHPIAGRVPPPPPPPPPPVDSGKAPLPSVADGKIAASPPRPFFSCDNDLNQKYYNDKCVNDTECFGGDSSMSCVKGVCTCKENFVPEDRFVGEAAAQKVCVPAPYLFASCNSTCQKPFVCKPYEGSTSNFCQCDAPYKLKDSSCFLECKDDETYDQTTAKCTPKCKSNELKINATCKSQRGIGSDCEINIQCVAAYSECKSKKCACLPGFSAKGDTCVPQTASCPSGDALKNDAGGFMRCIISTTKVDDKKPPPQTPVASLAPGGAARSFAVPYPGQDLKDNCPDTHFCVVTGGKVYAADSDGICCPKIKTTCPFGSPHPKAACTWQTSSGGEFCPWETHYCYDLSVGNSRSNEVCCPRECSQNTVAVKGKCLPTAVLGDACIENEQCTDSNAGCVKGFCKCINGSKESDSVYKYCTRDCKDSEVLFNNACFSRLSLGDSCEGQDWRCPLNAYCNNKKVCGCLCGMFTLSKDICAPAPSCPRPLTGIMPFAASAESAPGGGEKLAKISEEKKAELLKNVTFCTVKGAKAASDIKAVDTCGKNQYCATYIQNLGVCCTIPSAICQDGNKPVTAKPCDITNPLSCGPNNNCYQYLSPADPDNTIGRICCKSFIFNPNPLPPQ